MQEATLEKRINWWKWGVTAFAVTLISAYFWYFGFRLEQPAAENADKWGQFGDFVGGLLNPLVAFAAFYWLTQSVKIQKTELSESRKALNKSADAQSEQAKLSELHTRIAALTAMVNSLQQQDQILQGHISRKLLENENLEAEIKELVQYSKRVPPGKCGLDSDEAREVNEKIEYKRHKSSIKLSEAGELSLSLHKLRSERDEYLNELRLLLKSSEAPR